MSDPARLAIADIITRLAATTIKAAGVDPDSVTKASVELNGDQAAIDQAAAEAVELRDAIRAGFNLLGGVLTDLNRIADAVEVVASPALASADSLVAVPGVLSAEQIERIRSFAASVVQLGDDNEPSGD